MKHVEVVCAIIRNDKNEIFVCKRGPGKSLEGKWEFPGGKIEPNESYEDTIIREIKEELNSYIKPLKYIGTITHEYKNIDKPFIITMHGYECSLVKGDLTLLEHSEKKWVRIDLLNTLDLAEADILLAKMINE